MIRASVATVILALFCGMSVNSCASESRIPVFNSSFDLGEPGQPAPGFYIRSFLVPKAAYANPDQTYLPMTAPEGVRGNYLLIPGVAGRSEYNVQSDWFYVPRDGEVEVSFFAKQSADNSGVYRQTSVILDFRCFNLDVKYGPVTVRYPVLVCRRFNPDKKWQQFTFRVPVKTGYPYSLWFRHAAKTPGDSLNTLAIDELRIIYVNHAPTPAQNELVALANKSIPAYSQGDSVRFSLRALLHSTRPQETVRMLIREDNFDQICRETPVTLRRAATPNTAGQDQRSLYRGTIEIPAERFGSYSSRFLLKDTPLAAKGGDFAVIHPVVEHPRYSPGWTLGIGSGITRAYFFPMLGGNHNALVTTNGISTAFELTRLAGIKLNRYWCNWKLVEPQEGDFRKDLVAAELALNKRYGLDTLLQLGCTFTHAPPRDAPPKKIRGKLPTFVYKKFTVRPGVALPSVAAWSAYVKYLVDNFSDRVDLWEVVNEPGNGWKPEEYLPLLQSAYTIIKAKNPKAVVVGNGATGDLGLRPIGWTRELAKLGHEAFLDAVAFHPYEAGHDFQNGSYFKFSSLVKGLRDALRQPRPLWLTECFYLYSVRRKQRQHGWELTNFKAGDLQRHHLLGLLNKITASASITMGSLVKRNACAGLNAVPTENLVGMNTLSFLLRDMRTLLPLKLNRYLRAGVFASENRRKGMGFIWDLRPGGSILVPAPVTTKPGNINLLDTFGNPLPMAAEIHISHDPLFLRGESQALVKFLQNARIQPNSPVTLRARQFGNDLYVEGENKSGAVCNLLARFASVRGLRFPERTQFMFQDIEYHWSLLPGVFTPEADHDIKTIRWASSLDANNDFSHKLTILPHTGSHVIPEKSEKLTLRMNRESQLRVWATATDLLLEVTVRDDDIVPPKGDGIWTGDAMEVFIDANPFHRLDQDLCYGGGEKMNALQYAFAARPSTTNRLVRAFHRRNPGFKTRATCSSKIHDTGYTLTASIPWNEINPGHFMSGIIGMDIEIDHVGNGKILKESLGGKPGKCFKQRLHYPLFRLPAMVRKGMRARALELFGAEQLANSDFEDNEDQSWRFSGMATPFSKYEDEAGINSSRCAHIAIPPAAMDKLIANENYRRNGACVYQRLTCKPRSNKRINVQFMLRMRNVTVVKPDLPTPYQKGFFIKVHYYDGKGKRHLNNDGVGLKTALLGTHGWQLLQLFSDIPDNATQITVSLGLAGGTAGEIWIDNVQTRYFER